MNLDFLLFLLTLLQYTRGVFGRSHRGDAPIDATMLTTNAARMRAGFPPLKPRSLQPPSRVVRARNPYPSTVYPNPVTGYIQVKRANDSTLEGYVKKGCNITSLLGLTHNDDDRMSITFTPINPFNIAINNPPGPYAFLGFAGNNLTGNLSNYMVETHPTSSGSRPLPVGNSFNSTVQNSESAIWSYDSQRRRLTPRWINSDGRSISPYLWLYPSSDVLAIVANRTGQSSDSYRVYFTVVSS